jgi:hypothetical protein
VKINLDHYIIGKSFIQFWFLAHSKDDPVYATSFLSCVLYTPIIVVAFYVSESVGWSQETLDEIDKHVNFFGYKEILGIPEGCPWRMK